MTHLQVEGAEFDYVTAEEAVIEVPATWPGKNFDRQLALATSLDTRLVFFKNMFSPELKNYYWLTWQKSMDLKDLDQRVVNSDVREQDFRLAFRTNFSITHCPVCRSVFNTLIIDAGDPYPNSPRLHRLKIEQLHVLPCPKCGGGLRQLVVKIID